MTNDQKAILALTADNERLRNAIGEIGPQAIEMHGEIERLRGLLREAYDGRQKPMTVGLCYRIGHTLNHAKADQPEPVVDRPWQEIVKNATRYIWLRENSPGAVCSAAWRVKAACEFSTPDEAVDAAITASKSEAAAK